MDAQAGLAHCLGQLSGVCRKCSQLYTLYTLIIKLVEDTEVGGRTASSRGMRRWNDQYPVKVCMYIWVLCVQRMSECVFECISVFAMNVCTSMYVCMYVCTYVCMYVCIGAEAGTIDRSSKPKVIESPKTEWNPSDEPTHRQRRTTIVTPTLDDTSVPVTHKSN
jgi:hypothetical protein